MERTRAARTRARHRLVAAGLAVGLGAAALVVAIPGAGAQAAPSTTAPAAPTTPAPEPEPVTPPTTAEPAPAPPLPPPTIPSHPNGEHSTFSPEETAAAQAELATLDDRQRTLLRQLQTTLDTLALRRWALVALAREVADARAALDAARAVEQEARAKVEQTKADLRRVQDEIVALAAIAYRTQKDTSAIGSLGALDLGTPGALARARNYTQAKSTILGARIDELTVLQRRLEVEQRAAEDARAAAEASAAELDARLAEQTAAFDTAAAASGRARSAAVRSLGADTSLVAQMLEPRFGADAISAVLAFTQAGQPLPPTLDGIFSLPIANPSLSSRYGIRIDPIEGTIGFHAGLDFAADARSPIRAAADGVVVVAGDCGGYGSCVVVDHGASLATLYGHASQVLVRVGDLVPAGHVVALVGSTGRSTGPHLHFEVRLRGAPIDPVPMLSA